jgi:carbon storage regulator
MLVLSRKIGERIVIPNCDLTITVVAIEGSKVRLGFSAPPEVGVYREEVWREIEEETPDTSPGARHVHEVKTGSKPFYLTVFHHGETSHEFDGDDEA